MPLCLCGVTAFSAMRYGHLRFRLTGLRALWLWWLRGVRRPNARRLDPGGEPALPFGLAFAHKPGCFALQSVHQDGGLAAIFPFQFFEALPSHRRDPWIEQVRRIGRVR